MPLNGRITGTVLMANNGIDVYGDLISLNLKRKAIACSNSKPYFFAELLAC
jgi:hypothetical protein